MFSRVKSYQTIDSHHARERLLLLYAYSWPNAEQDKQLSRNQEIQRQSNRFIEEKTSRDTVDRLTDSIRNQNKSYESFFYMYAHISFELSTDFILSIGIKL